MKFFVNSMGKSVAETRGSAFCTIWNPQYFRSGEEDDANKDSVDDVFSGCVRAEDGRKADRLRES